MTVRRTQTALERSGSPTGFAYDGGKENTIDILDRLARLIRDERETLLERWRAQVRELPSARGLDTPTLNDHIPDVLDELSAALRGRSEQTIPEALAEGSPPAHGLQRVKDSFDIEEVVAEYNILRQCLHDLASENGLSLQGEPFHVVNRVLDSAIGLAVQTFAAQKALDERQRREDYLAFVAHDLRTPLNAISLAARVLEVAIPDAEGNGNPQAARMLKALRRNVQHLEMLVGKVLEENTNLETEAGIKLERRDLDLWPLVEALVHDLHPVAGTSSTNLVNAIPEDLVVFADAKLLKRVLQNLIANAIAHTPRGEVVIEARELDAGVECLVRDNGRGISPERTLVVFEKHETDGQKDGAGLGLAIVKTFVEAHGGAVSVVSKLGDGSTFRFTLPAKPQPTPSPV